MPTVEDASVPAARQPVTEEELLATLPQERQDEIREVQRQPAANGWDVRVTDHWWGFAVHLNPKAAQDVATIVEEIGKIAAARPSFFGRAAACRWTSRTQTPRLA